jgi:hypothetical protein
LLLWGISTGALELSARSTEFRDVLDNFVEVLHQPRSPIADIIYLQLLKIG